MRSAVLVTITMLCACEGPKGSSPDFGVGPGLPGDDTSGQTETDDDTGAGDSGGFIDPSDEVEPPPECGQYCSTETTCALLDMETQQCLDDCAGRFGDFERIGDQCLYDYANLLACLAGLSCPQLESYYASAGQPMETGYPCRAQDVEVLINCQ